ncbi:hypothetical protein XBKB1_570007 [Xenorhabdus bovienii str. kraussei Becker Underwood]|uniref:Uncharacterized protein n=1 Tax=Xenorhabdus bovienii str. kraussei Becker Underwood TaxID=1398204 RepID=A0A077PYK4_XENBV|nr:hypothetical protein XBKB1_570007 [Xenorhabdus bovienii str. kraussei Becker Underwood]
MLLQIKMIINIVWQMITIYLYLRGYKLLCQIGALMEQLDGAIILKRIRE